MEDYINLKDKKGGGLFAKKDEEADQCCQCPKLSFKQRVTGFVICFGIGLILEAISVLCLFGVINRDKFPIIYTLGTIVTLMSSCFLSGPRSQWKKMTDKNRIITTTVLILSIVMVLVSAIVLKNQGLAILFLIIEVFAYLWYSLSFVPFGQRIVKRCFQEAVE